jgi:hypothetical protein
MASSLVDFSRMVPSYGGHDVLIFFTQAPVCTYVYIYVIIIQKANTTSSVGQHGPPTNAKVGSSAAEE